MVDRDPYSEWRPFTSTKSTTALTHDIICLHTMVGTLPGSWNFANQPGNAYWHYGLSCIGTLWQCQDLRFRSAANLNGNWHVIPIETADKDACFGPWTSCGQVPAWTQAQINKLIPLIAWLCLRYNIPPVLIPDTLVGRRGIAYHRQGINPWRVVNGELWSNATGKCCPDWRRIAQLTDLIIPAVQALVTPPQGDEFDMATLNDLHAVVNLQLDQNVTSFLCRQIGDPSGAVFLLSKTDGTRVWVPTAEGVSGLIMFGAQVPGPDQFFELSAEMMRGWHLLNPSPKDGIWASTPDEDTRLPWRIVREDWGTIPSEDVRIYLTNFGSYITEIEHQGLLDQHIITMLGEAGLPTRHELPQAVIEVMLGELEEIEPPAEPPPLA